MPFWKGGILGDCQCIGERLVKMILQDGTSIEFLKNVENDLNGHEEEVPHSKNYVKARGDWNSQ